MSDKHRTYMSTKLDQATLNLRLHDGEADGKLSFLMIEEWAAMSDNEYKVAARKTNSSSRQNHGQPPAQANAGQGEAHRPNTRSQNKEPTSATTTTEAEQGPV